jgi:hypothetical protein
MMLVKLPAPEPSEVLLSFIVGVPVLLQHTPLLIISSPPSEVITPPQKAEK